MSKHSTAYWHKRVFRCTYTRGGVRHEVKSFAVKLQCQGKRRTVQLYTNDKTTAAARAKVIYEKIVLHGWAALEQPKEAGVSIGDYCEAALAVLELSQRSRDNYVHALRTIAAGALGVTSADKYNPKSTEWRDTVDALPLSKLTGEKVQAWKRKFVSQAANPEEERRRKTSANSYLRNARSLFSNKAAKHVSLTVANPFTDVDLYPRMSHRYVSRVNAEKLLQMAELELPEEQMKIFYLAILCGLRKKEIDQLSWDLVDLDAGVLHLRNTEHLKLKSESSHGSIPLDPELLALLIEWKAKANSPFVIEAGSLLRSNQAYRCQTLFKDLYSWLRRNGVSSQKPLHELRKECGHIVCKRHGIYVASRMLRHGDLSTTTRHYVADPEEMSTGLQIRKRV